MDIKDALTVTMLGISVVFIGLVLTNLMINSFSLLPKLAALFKRSGAEESAASAAAPDVAAPVEAVASGPITPEILAVITSVLEVELRLRESLTEGKFTFK